MCCQPEVLEQIHSLKELWLDNNSLQSIPGVRTAERNVHVNMAPCYSNGSLHVLSSTVSRETSSVAVLGLG